MKVVTQVVVQKPVRVYAFLTIDNGTAIIKGNAVKARFGNDIGVGGVFESCFTCWAIPLDIPRL